MIVLPPRGKPPLLVGVPPVFLSVGFSIVVFSSLVLFAYFSSSFFVSGITTTTGFGGGGGGGGKIRLGVSLQTYHATNLEYGR